MLDRGAGRNQILADWDYPDDLLLRIRQCLIVPIIAGPRSEDLLSWRHLAV